MTWERELEATHLCLCFPFPSTLLGTSLSYDPQPTVEGQSLCYDSWKQGLQAICPKHPGQVAWEESHTSSEASFLACSLLRTGCSPRSILFSLPPAEAPPSMPLFLTDFSLVSLADYFRHQLRRCQRKPMSSGTKMLGHIASENRKMIPSASLTLV